MRKKKAFRQMLRADAAEMNTADVRRLLDAELEKSEPDPTLVEACLDALSPADGGGAGQTARRRIPVRAALIAAAAAVLLALSTLAAGAVFRVDLFGTLVELYRDRIRIGHTEEWNTEVYALSNTALAKELAAHGIAPVLLPAALTDGTCTVDGVQVEETELIVSANVLFHAGRVSGSMVISVYGEGAALPVTDYAQAEDVKVLCCGEIPVYVFSQAGNAVIDYADGRTVYTVILDGNLDDAVRLAETIN